MYPSEGRGLVDGRLELNMKLNRHIRKLLFVGLWSIIGAGVLVLLVAAIRNRKDKTCAGYEISLTGEGGNGL
ncbi:hypothetical protein [Paraflavitalea speifideaquila]|uniref:hypothetical protein n=1 Tax=Paraflavitalea speifideaquila TaxID=3076558 RepID=UPI0028ED9FAC|nr:hypothetical protein [Paraflavitalea speifideiaquila]